MKFNISSGTHPIHLTRQAMFDIAADSGARVYLAEGPFGRVVFQVIDTGAFTTQNDFYAIEDKFSLSFEGDDPVLQMLVCLKGDLHFNISGIGRVHLQQGQFIMLYVPSMAGSALFDRPAELLVFNLHFPYDSLQSFMLLFPIAGFMTEMDMSRPALLFKQSGWVTHDILKAITYLLAFPDEPQREYFYAIKVKELLLLFLQQKFYTGEAILSEATLESVRHARHLIESHIGGTPDLEAVAQLAGIDPGLLKEHFKTVVGVSMTVFVLRARMNTAHLLILDTNLPIHEIAVILGYTHPQDFIEAFKKTFHYTPLTLRKGKL